MTNNKSLIILGVASFAAFLAYFYVTSAPQVDPTPATALAVRPAPVVDTDPVAAPAELIDSNAEPVMPDPADVDLATALDDGGYFDDSSYPDTETDDDMLIIEQGDATRYVTAIDREAQRVRQQLAKESSLNAAGYVGDDRLRAIGTLGSYAAEGNSEAVSELRNMLQSTDDELRGDALEALAELLPGTNVVPAYAEEPPTDSEIDGIIAALQSLE